MKKIQTKAVTIRFFESIIVITYILFEEIIWNIFAAPIVRTLKSLIVLEAMESTFLAMNRYLLLFIFIVILAIAEVLGILSGISILNGFVFTGIFIYALKIPVAAFVFWLFDLTKAKLLKFQWLKTCYEFMMRIIEKIINSSIHQSIKSGILIFREQARTILNKYRGKTHFIASIKSHYLHFKSRH